MSTTETTIWTLSSARKTLISVGKRRLRAYLRDPL